MSYGELSMPSVPSQLNIESDCRLLESQNESQVRPSTSLFYEPSANKNE